MRGVSCYSDGMRSWTSLLLFLMMCAPSISDVHARKARLDIRHLLDVAASDTQPTRDADPRASCANGGPCSEFRTCHFDPPLESDDERWLIAQAAVSDDAARAEEERATTSERPVDPDVVKRFTGRVRSVGDGDTIVVEDDDKHRNKVRLSGIDAPERGGQSTYGQPYAQRSRQNLSKLIYRGAVRVDWRTYDGFGRMIGRVWLGDVDAGLHQVCAGYAWVYREFVGDFSPDELRAYLDCEQAARAERRGLWRDSNPVAPWDWRHSPRRKELEP